MSSSQKIRVVHIIPGLVKAGAETMLYQIIKYKTDDTIIHKVISLGMSTYYEDYIRDEGCEVEVFDLRRHPIRTIMNIRRGLKNNDVLCCWMYLGNLIGYIAGRGRVEKVIWNIRHADLNPGVNNRITLLSNFICSKFSKKIDVITYNGNRARKNHIEYGYSNLRSKTLRNGCDTSFYRYNGHSRETIRRELGISECQSVILSVGRNHKIKDLPCFVRAFSVVHDAIPESVAIMCGREVDNNNDDLVRLCESVGLNVGKDIHLLGFRDDVRDLLCAADLYVLHSAGEAFPNTLIQAMSCSRLCVTTDVGDAREIMPNREYIIQIGDSDLLARKCIDILRLKEEEKEILRASNRQIVLDEYDIHEVVKQYETCITGISIDRVLYVGQFEMPDKNAAANRVTGIAKSMRECGANVVFCGVSKNEMISDNDITNKKEQTFDSYSRKYPVRIMDWLKYIFDINVYTKLAEKYGSNCIICYNLPTLLNLRIMHYCRRQGITCIADVTEWYHSNWRKWYVFIVKQIDEFFRMRIINKKMDGLIVISRYLESYYEGVVRTIRIPPTIDATDQIWTDGIHKESNTIRFVFASKEIVRDKANLLIDALSKVQREYSLAFAGVTESEYLNVFPHQKELVTENQSITFLGNISHRETIEQIKKADYLCFFRDKNITSISGFPTKYVEAKSCGTPVLTNNTSDLALFEGDGDVIIKSELDVDMIAGIIEQLKCERGNAYRRFDYHNYIDETKKILGAISAG